jgi:hypothetical protein
MHATTTSSGRESPKAGYLRKNGDDRLDYVHSMPYQYGVDFVSMIVDTDSASGIGYYMPSTPSVRWDHPMAWEDTATGMLVR